MQLRRGVGAECQHSGITRKRKLLEKQKEGKKRMRTLGNISIPQEAFMAILDPKPIFDSVWTGEPAWLLINADFQAKSAPEVANVVP